MKALIIFGSTTSNTATAAEKISTSLNNKNIETKLLNATEVISQDDFANFDLILFGSSTWGLGELQDDWFNINFLKDLNLDRKYIAFFGTGDQHGFSDTFIDALGILYNDVKDSGATLVGKWSTANYEFDDSVALLDDTNFVGLALDEENQAELTDERIEQWTNQIIQEIK
ncbi:flavodoxin [Lentisphaerota bacterium WC36G]|nr:flavodoxin [Lentisphaerae bacterium WC36]